MTYVSFLAWLGRNAQYANICKYVIEHVYKVANFIWYANQDVFSSHAGSDST